MKNNWVIPFRPPRYRKSRESEEIEKNWATAEKLCTITESERLGETKDCLSVENVGVWDVIYELSTTWDRKKLFERHMEKKFANAISIERNETNESNERSWHLDRDVAQFFLHFDDYRLRFVDYW